tara:strand:- start:2585 stop:3130 length:546 start_codon:yes stop_codon:yes gene_type:complete
MNREILKEYAKLRKLPKWIYLGSISDYVCDNFNSISLNLENTNERNIENRKKLGLHYDEYKSPLGTVYQTKHKDDLNVSTISCIKDFKQTFNWRFGELNPNGEVPEHLDTHKTLRFLIILTGYCDYVAENDKIRMNKGDVYCLNTGFKHKVLNGPYTRLALLGEMNNNEKNIELLRARTRK